MTGAALDIDNERDYETMKIRFRFWREYQNCLINTLSKSRDAILSRNNDENHLSLFCVLGRFLVYVEQGCLGLGSRDTYCSR